MRGKGWFKMATKGYVKTAKTKEKMIVYYVSEVIYTLKEPKNIKLRFPAKPKLPSRVRMAFE